MLKRILFFVLFYFAIHQGLAQSPFGASIPEFTTNIYYVEVGGGGIVPAMGFYNNQYRNLNASLFFGQTQELALRMQYCHQKSFAARISFRSQGVKFSEQSGYLMRANYLNLFVPFEYDIRSKDWRKKSTPSLVFFGGPWVGYRVGGFVQSDIQEKVQLSHDLINPVDAGLELGLGMRIPIFSFTSRGFITVKLSAFHGAVNTLPALNKTADFNREAMLLPEDGYRFSRGVRMTLNYEMSLIKKAVTTFTAGGDGKRTYQRFVVP